ncbi:MAG: TGS domain-containing protein, partial [Planctomycetota bacterium]|nr:TGS domain-containing protein [Planctomycetota bacterium]
RLNGTKTRLARQSSLDDEDVGLSFTQTLLVANKMDLPDATERLALLHEMCPLDLPELEVSATAGTGLETLRNDIYAALDVVRVYTKLPTRKTADFERPFTMRKGGTVLDIAEQVHQDLAANFKHARVWGVGMHDGSIAKGDHVLHDKDIVELHTG